MKKLIVSLFTVATLGFATAGVYANIASSDVMVSISQEEDKTEVAAKDLPEAVKEGWAKSNYQNEKVEKIFKVKSSGVEYFEFIVVTASGKVAVHLDNTGNVLKEKAVL